jgi:hypothetical protein
MSTMTDAAIDLDLPVLDVDRLGQIITWAALDHRLIEQAEAMTAEEKARLEQTRQEKFGDWGKWDQGHWALLRAEQPRNGVCGTALCMAGQTVASDPRYALAHIGGGLDAYDPDDEFDVTTCVRLSDLPALAPGQHYPTVVDSEKHGFSYDQTASIEVTATSLLGLSSAEASALFCGDNEIETIVGCAEVFAAVRGLSLSLPPWVLEYAPDYEDTFSHLDTYMEDDYRSAAAEAVGYTLTS